jgi:hypothetical protein
MKQPECPPKGKVMVLSNSFFEEWKPEIVPEMFDDAVAAEEWIRAKLDEEPGDLYVIVSVESMFWAQIQIRKSERKKK